MSAGDLHSSENEDSGQLWIAPKIARVSTQPTAATAGRKLRQVQSMVEKSSGSRRVRRGAQLEPRLSAVQTAAWVAPRLALLFALGWAWSAGVQFIHAQTGGRASFGDYDSSDSDDGERVVRDVMARALGAARWSDVLSGAMTVAVGLGYPFLDRRWRRHPRAPVSWHDVLRCVGGFLGVNYAALKLPFETAQQAALLMLIISLGLWTLCDGTLHGLLVSAAAALSCTWLLFMHVLELRTGFVRDDYLSLLAFLPSVLFTYCVMTGSIGRRLGHRPQ